MTAPAVGLIFDEKMEGGFAMGATDPEGGGKLGKAAATSFTLKSRITVANVDQFIADPDHSAKLEATIHFPPLGEHITCTPGVFQELRQSDDPTVKLMIYACGFEAKGQRYFLEGQTFVHDHVPLHTMMEQTTTLYAKLHAGDDTSGPVVGAGVLHLGVLGVVEMVASMHTVGASSPEQSARAIADFGLFFLGQLWQSYSAHVSGPEGPLLPNVSQPRGGRTVQPRERLAYPAADLHDGATAAVVIIGSGYGGGVAASRLARAVPEGQKVMVLERGKEWRAGDFPNTPLQAAAQFQVDSALGHAGANSGLYDLRINAQVDVLVGCGLGGTSLINANVSLEPNPEVFDDPRWPQAIRDDRTTLLADGYDRARAMLMPNPYPADQPQLPKLSALARSADSINRPFDRAPINVAFADRVNPAGVQQAKCTLCGDCVTGCNYTAKTTVDMTFLPDAKNHGAEIYTEVTVRWIERVGDKLKVVWRWTEAKDDASLREVIADVVIVSGGVLGSTEILLRSAEHGLPMSPNVGQKMSANGDYLSFPYNNDFPVDAIGAGNRPLAKVGPVGPTITGVISPPPGQQLSDQYIVEEGAIPGALADALPLAFAVAAGALGVNTATSIPARLAQADRQLKSLDPGGGGAYVGAVKNTQTFLTIGHDDADGTLQLNSDRLRVVWPGAGEQPIYTAMQQTTTDATKVGQGISVKEPIWTDVLHYNLITVHPLGGVPMGEAAEQGAVNDRGQLFSGTTGTAVHSGLYVIDGSIIPTSLGVNPLLTISALAERAMTLLIRDQGWKEG